MTHTFKVGQLLTCINNERNDYNNSGLTVGKDYPVFDLATDAVIVKDDTGTLAFYYTKKAGITAASTYFTWPGKPTYAKDMAKILRSGTSTRSEQLAAALLDSPEPHYQPSRLDYFTAAALTGVLATGKNGSYLNYAEQAVEFAKETIKQLDQ